MLQIGFYQLCDASVNDAVMMLIRKALVADKKMLIYCPKPAADKIDDALWSHDPEFWLPHGLDTAPGAELSAVWVCTDMSSNPINSDYIMLLHGAVPQCWDGFERAFVLFDEKSDVQLQQARAYWHEWRAWPRAELTYFAQTNDGRWVKKS